MKTKIKTIYYKELTPRSAKSRIDILVKEYKKSLDFWNECVALDKRLGLEGNVTTKCAWEKLDGLNTALRILGVTDLECLAD